jgi:transposase-like protein
MTGKRKRYSADFKAKVTLEALKGELTLEVAPVVRTAWRLG